MPTNSIEAERLKALRALDVLDSAPEPEFDLVTSLAAALFNVPVALLSLIDAERQWFKSRHGIEICSTERSVAFCSHAIEADGVLEVPDAVQDPRFATNPLVLGAPGIRYYAGAPLKLGSGHRIGTLCLIDIAPRVPLGEDKKDLLQRLAALAVVQFELRQLRQAGAMASAVAAATPDAIICAGADGFISHWNAGAERLFGHSAAAAVGEPLELIIPEHMRAAHSRGMDRLARTGEERLVGDTVEVPGLRRDGTTVPIELSLAAWKDEAGRYAGFGAIARDLTARKALEAEKAETQLFLDTVLANLPAMLFVKDAATREYLLWNRTAEDATGLDAAQVVGRTDAQLFAGPGEQYMQRDELTLRTGIPQSHESRFVRPDGEERIFRTRRSSIPDRTGAPRYLLGISEDVTEWRAAQDRLAFLAGHDPLTHLHNRARFAERLEAALAKGGAPAVLAINLDRFKAFNDSQGHDIGDLLLIEVARLLRQLGEPEDHAARLAGDEFALLLNGPGAEARAARAADAINVALARPIAIAGVQLRAAASIGIALAPDHGRDGEELLANADLALHRAKQGGGARSCFFDPRMDKAARERRRIEALLRGAIAGDQIQLHYQPLASIESGRVVGFEALARWQHPELGDVRPDIFIPVAEESGLIVELGRKVLRMAVAEAARWQPALGISVNLSPVQVQHPDLYDEVAGVLAEFGLAPERLELEVTEGVMIRDADNAIATLKRLKALGVSISMDDFGTGYSSLSYFRLFPFDKVKIDQSFIRDMGESPQAMAIVQAVIGLARGLGLPVVAEGVENDEQFNALLAEGCTQVQGYLLGRPAPIDAFLGTAIERRLDLPTEAGRAG